MSLNALNTFVANCTLDTLVLVALLVMLTICFIIFELPGAELTWKKLIMVPTDVKFK